MSIDPVALTPDDVHRLRGRLHVVLGYAEMGYDSQDEATRDKVLSSVLRAAREALAVLEPGASRQQ